MNTALGPDFFIVGAPKSGTTSLDGWLSQHPKIFMARKEQHYFGSDLDELWSSQLSPRITWNEYLSRFAAGADATRRGESSVWYLSSRLAAEEIHAYRPDAQIIVMLRNPVDLLPSLHSQYVYEHIEDLRSFEAALAAESDRRAGRRIPPNNGVVPWRLFYRDVVRFDEQLPRYFETFGRERVHVIVFDDLAVDSTQTFRGVLRFLGVDDDFVPQLSVANSNKRIRSRRVQQAMSEISNPASRVRRFGKRAIPIHRVRSAMLRHSLPALKRANTAIEPRSEIDPQMRMQLAAEFAPGIMRLEELLGRDLGLWYAGTAQSEGLLQIRQTPSA